jgi:hypothetical protein
MVAGVLVPVARAGFQLVSRNSGKILNTVAVGGILSTAWDWLTGDDDDDRRRELVKELHEVRSELAEPGKDLQEASALAQRDAQIQDELERLGIEVRATFGDPGEQRAAEQNVQRAQAAGFDAPSITAGANITSLDLKELSLLNKDVDLVASAYRIPISALPELIKSMKRLQAYSYDQLTDLMKVFS